ncbi:MAG: hypothetical protein RLO19_14750 [Coleofasciculus sp. G2-EDA-02]
MPTKPSRARRWLRCPSPGGYAEPGEGQRTR